MRQMIELKWRQIVILRLNYGNRRLLWALAWLLPQWIGTGSALADDHFLRPRFGTGASEPTQVAIKIAELTENMEVWGLDFSPDGKYLAATSIMDSNEVHVWDWKDMKVIIRRLDKGRGSFGAITEPLRYSPDGRYLVACHSRIEKYVLIHVWDVQTGTVARAIDDPTGGGCTAIAFTPDGQFLVRVGTTGPRPQDNIIVYRTADWQPSWSLRTTNFLSTTLAISPDGAFAAVGGVLITPGSSSYQPQILVIDLLKHNIVRAIHAFPVNNWIQSIGWSPDGRHIAAGTIVGGSFKGPDIVKIFDAATGNQSAGESVGGPGHLITLRYSPDGKYLAESGVNRSIRIWDGRHQTLLQEIPGEAGSLAFSHDGRFLSMGGDKKILIWQMK